MKEKINIFIITVFFNNNLNFFAMVLLSKFYQILFKIFNKSVFLCSFHEKFNLKCLIVQCEVFFSLGLEQYKY